MTSATQRITRLQTDIEHLQNDRVLMDKIVQEKDDTIIRQQQANAAQMIEISRNKRRITDLQDLNSTNNELIKQHRFIIDSQKDEIAELKKELDEAKVQNDNLKKQLEAANERMRTLENQPMTPPPTPNPASQTTSQNTRKRKVFIPDATQRHIKIWELKLRSNSRSMFRCSFGASTVSKEYHVEDIANHFPEPTKEFLASRRKFRRGNQIRSIKLHDIECLTKIINEIEQESDEEREMFEHN